jgi:hypothetical protein
MKRILSLCLTAALPLAAAENLLPNGSFDDGDKTAAHWEPANGLTTFYETEPGHGRIVRLDTLVDRKQAMDWAKAFAADPTLPVPAKKPIPPDSYGSIGGNEGVALDSELIDCVPGQNYKLTADVKGVGKPFVWIKGFLWHPARKAWVDGYQTRLEPPGASTNKWTTFSIGFNPTARSPRVAKMKVRLYAYWPNGLYWFDNIRIEAITPEEMDALVKQRGIPADKGTKK